MARPQYADSTSDSLFPFGWMYLMQFVFIHYTMTAWLQNTS